MGWALNTVTRYDFTPSPSPSPSPSHSLMLPTLQSEVKAEYTIRPCAEGQMPLHSHGVRRTLMLTLTLTLTAAHPHPHPHPHSPSLLTLTAHPHCPPSHSRSHSPSHLTTQRRTNALWEGVIPHLLRDDENFVENNIVSMRYYKSCRLNLVSKAFANALRLVLPNGECPCSHSCSHSCSPSRLTPTLTLTLMLTLMLTLTPHAHPHAHAHPYTLAPSPLSSRCGMPSHGLRSCGEWESGVRGVRGVRGVAAPWCERSGVVAI